MGLGSCKLLAASRLDVSTVVGGGCLWAIKLIEFIRHTAKTGIPNRLFKTPMVNEFRVTGGSSKGLR